MNHIGPTVWYCDDLISVQSVLWLLVFSCLTRYLFCSVYWHLVELCSLDEEGIFLAYCIGVILGLKQCITAEAAALEEAVQMGLVLVSGITGMSAFCLGSFINCSGAILDDQDGSQLRGQLWVYCAPSADWVIKVNGGWVCWMMLPVNSGALLEISSIYSTTKVMLIECMVM